MVCVLLVLIFSMVGFDLLFNNVGLDLVALRLGCFVWFIGLVWFIVRFVGCAFWC